MRSFTSSRTIAAAPERVFDTIAHIDNFREVIPQITAVEYVGETRRGVGTRFKETRTMKGRAATTELEVTEYEPSHRVRIISDSGGALWDTVFTVTATGTGSELNMVMKATPYRPSAHISIRVVAPMIRKALENDMDAVKAYCESPDV